MLGLGNKSFDHKDEEFSKKKLVELGIGELGEELLQDPENMKNLIRRKSCNCRHCGGFFSNMRK
jgi:hypothetical protein